MRRAKYPVNLTEEEREILVQITRKHKAEQSMVRRARILLMSDAGVRNQTIAGELGVGNQLVTIWTKRWCETVGKPVLERLQDLPRSGAPDKFTPEQHCLIVALACEKPTDHGRPITDWTQRELAEEAIKQGIVESISPCHVGRMLKKRLAAPSHPILAEC
jgi:putative transposase